MTEQLDAFLASGTPPEGAPEPPAPPEPESKPTPPEAAPDAAEAPAKSAETSTEPEDDVPPHSGSDTRTVPLATLEKVRNDWKSKYAAEQARAELLAKQLEEAKKPPPPSPQAAPQQQYIPPPDPSVDPQGWAMHMFQENQRAMLNERLNNSEMMLREKLGDEKVNEYAAEFRRLAQADQTLFGKLYSQPHPYSWLTREVDRLRLHSEIGDDPTAFKARIEAEARAKWEAEMAQQPANGGGRTSPAAGLPPSLANARSVAGRTTTTFTGPPPIEELFPGHNRRAERQR
jgi:hypothetical protein